jgi:hypothetical protein
VRTWRRLQELGAIPVKQTVYALPDSAESREDFEWLRVEIEGAGGEAVIFAAEHLSADAEAALVDEFRRHRQAAYAELASETPAVSSEENHRSEPALSAGDRPVSRTISSDSNALISSEARVAIESPRCLQP